MPDLHGRVIAALESKPRDDGMVVWKDGRVLAERHPAPGGSAWVIALDVEPFRFPHPAPEAVRQWARYIIERGPARSDQDGA